MPEQSANDGPKTSPNPLVSWRDLLRLVESAFFLVMFLAVCWIVLAVCYFPRATDDWEQSGQADLAGAEAFYEDVYSGTAPDDPDDGQAADETADEASDETAEPAEDQHHAYVLMGRRIAGDIGVSETIKNFVEQYGLENSRALEVGAGSGQLQDIVPDYTGLDIAASAARYFHKPFVAGSATDLPFEDGSFDSVWSVWTIEHVPNPERALEEMRRVTRSGGYLFLWPTWLCPRWLSEGYLVRPYSDFDWVGKANKLSVVFRSSPYLLFPGLASVRTLRELYWRATGAEMRLRFDRLEPNFEDYWTPDADAAISLDGHETMLWFRSRGDDCLNCPEDFAERLQMTVEPLIIRVNKSGSAAGP